MTRSTEFATTVKNGMRSSQPFVVVHAHRVADESGGPRVGFVVTKAIGSAVERHRAARRLRHAARTALPALGPSDRIVVRARPGVGTVGWEELCRQIRTGIAKALAGGSR